MTRVCMDTNVYIALVKGKSEVLDLIESAQQVFVPIAVIGELLAGFKLGSKEKKNRKTFDDFLEMSTIKVVPISRETAEIFAEIKSDLSRRGKPIPINDIWIAAQTIETGSVLMTYDRHFQHVTGLRLWK